MRNYLFLLFSMLCISVNFVMAQDKYDFEEIFGIKMGENVSNVRDFSRYEKYEIKEDHRKCSFGENVRSYSYSEIDKDSPERMLLNFTTIDNIVAHLDITLIKKSDDQFNDFIDQHFSFLVTKWNDPVYYDGSYTDFNNDNSLELGYNFTPNTEAIKSIIYNRYGNENDEHRGITIRYESDAHLKAINQYIDCSFSLK